MGLPVSSRTSAHVASETAVQDARWTFGGGTVLMLRIAHRHSKDIDLFVPDPQYLGFVNPRLSDAAESISADYEEAAEYIKLFLARGDRRGGWNVADRNSIRNDRLSRADDSRGNVGGNHCQEDVAIVAIAPKDEISLPCAPSGSPSPSNCE